MLENWKIVKVGDICKTNKSTYSLSENWDYVNYLDTGSLTQDKVDEYKKIVIGTNKLPSRARRKIEYNDILYSTVRPNQLHYGIVKNVIPKTLVSTGFAVITTDKEQADSDYLYYFLIQDSITETLHAIGEQSTSAYPSIKPSDIENLNIILPPLEMQKEVSKILRVLDEKIRNNRKINHHLEQMAEELYSSYFINYNHVENFKSTEIGNIPLGWNVVNLSEIAEITNGYSYKGTELISSSTAMATIKNFNRKGGFKVDGFKELMPSGKIKSTHFVTDTEVLIAHTDLTQNADIIGNSEILLSHYGYSAIVASMDLVKLSSKIPEISNYTIFLMTKNKLFKEYCLRFVNGTTVLHLSKKAVPNYQLAIPEDISKFIEFNNLISPLFERMSEIITENQRLITLRDTLLPKLMSGELSVSD